MKVMLSCGEPSGDLYAGALAAEIRRLDPAAELFGLGGPRCAGAGVRLTGDYRGLTVTGLTEAIRVLPQSLAMYRRLVAAARASRPDVFVPIDFPDFNFRLAAAVNRLGIPVVYYVSPQLWAWRAGRIRALGRFARKVLVIFPFEAEVYERAAIPVEFVGHPLVDLAVAESPRSAFLSELGLDPQAPTVALLPGSRPNEVSRILPVMLEARQPIRARVPDAQFVVARAPNLDSSLFVEADSRLDQRLAVVEARTDDVLASSDAVVTASGTATVQAALHERPMVIVYRLSPLTYAVGRPLVRVSTYGMVNLVAGRTIVRELIQDDFTAAAVAAEIVTLLTDPARAAAMQGELRGVKSRLGDPGASRRAAVAVLQAARSLTGSPAVS